MIEHHVREFCLFCTIKSPACHVNSVTRQTRYYLGDYEEEVDASGNIRKIHYLSGGAVLIRNNGQYSLLYGYADYLGSLTTLTDANGNVLERYAYCLNNPFKYTDPSGNAFYGGIGFNWS